MRPGAALFVAFLFAVSVGLVPLAAGASAVTQEDVHPRIVPVENSSNYLAIPSEEVQRTAITADGLDISTAVAVDVQQLRAEHSALAAEQAFHEADTRSGRYVALVDFLEGMEARSASLQDRDQAVIAAFTNGSMSASSFARERARIAADASTLQRAVARVQTIAVTEAAFTVERDLGTRFENVKGELEVRQGPVSEQILRAKTGTHDQQRVYVGTGGGGYTMMIVGDGEYVRETYLASERVPNGTDLFDESEEARLTAAYSRGYELYPWAETQQRSSSRKALGSSGMYRLKADFPRGSLTAYIDGNTTNVFREYQHHRISTLPMSKSLQVTNGTLRVVVNRTYETGPMHLSVERTSSGVSTDATVAVDGHELGSTGPDGSMWLVEQPHPTRLNVTADDGDTVSFQLPLP